MLKVNTQLFRALRYQAVVGAERNTGHFDDSAKDQVGPPSRGLQRLAPEERRVVATGIATPNLRAKLDVSTGDWVGFFSSTSR